MKINCDSCGSELADAENQDAAEKIIIDSGGSVKRGILRRVLCAGCSAQQRVQRTDVNVGKKFNPYDLNDVARVDEIVKRRR